MSKKFYYSDLITLLMKITKSKQINWGTFLINDEGADLEPSMVSKIKKGERNLPAGVVKNSAKIAKDVAEEAGYVFGSGDYDEDYNRAVEWLVDYLKDNDFTDMVQKVTEALNIDSDEERLRQAIEVLIICANENPKKEIKKQPKKESTSAVEIRKIQSNLPNIDRKVLGRDNIYANINQLFFTENKVAIVLSGLGGIGKSVVAIKYAEDYRDNFPNFIRYVEFDPSQDFKTNISNQLLPEYISGEDKLDERFSRTVQMLQNQNPGGLVIVDNMTQYPGDMDGYQDLIQTGNVRYIFVTRESGVEFDNVVEVGGLSTVEQIKLFELYAFDGQKVNGEEKDALMRILNMINGHTLAIELLAKYVKQSWMSVSGLENLVNDNRDRLSRLDDTKIQTVRDYRTAQPEISTVMHVIENVFNVSELDDVQKFMLFFASQLPLAGFSGRKFIDLTCKAEFLPGPTITQLIELGWLRVEFNDNDRKIIAHPLIREVVNAECHYDFDEIRYFLVNIHEVLHQESSFEQLNEYSMIIDNMIKHISGDVDWELIDNIADGLSDKHAYAYLVPIYEKLVENRPTDDNYLRFGDILVRLGKFNRAIDTYKMYIDMLESSEMCYEERVKILTIIGNLYRKQAKYDEAEVYFDKALAEFKGHDGVGLIYADIYNRKGINFINQGDLEEAEVAYEEALRIREKSDAPENEKNEQIAYSKHNLGTVYRRRAEISNSNDLAKKALEYHLEALELRKIAKPPRYDQLGQSYTQVGSDYVLLGDFVAAEKNLKQGLDVRIKQYGDVENNEIAWANYGLADMYLKSGDYSQALKYAQRTYDIRNGSFELDKNYQYLFESAVQLAWIYQRINNEKLTNAYFEKANQINSRLKNDNKKEANQKQLADLLEIINH